ncbi:MAG TPA: efflux RND transporter periplasmic adaptor subunit [Candidatus Paceibacterota bacterium]|nr:efflux RND transporter periplasmic adaptor subunit [Candidatus Paceibacterota bacterium]HPT17975.1 efflux RND transporter periplasmic adaptor subunit [Candidatus Paceibacterota bacterium]
MKEKFNKIKLYIKSHKKLSIIVLIVILALGFYGYKKISDTSGETRYVTAVVEKGTIISSITGTGQVSASNSIDLTADATGKITYIGVSAGDQVKKGKTLFSIDSTEAQKAVRDAEISLESAKLSYKQTQLQNSEETMNDDLEKAYDDGFNTLSNTFTDLQSTFDELDSLLGESILSQNSARLTGTTAQDYREKAETAFYQAQKSFKSNRATFRLLDRNSATSEDIDSIMSETYKTTKLASEAIKSLQSFVNYMADDAISSSDYSTYQSTLSSEANTINGDLTDISSAESTIKDSKEAFETANIETQSSDISIKQKENALQDAKDDLSDYYVTAPFDGKISSVDVEVGDTSSGTLGTIITDQRVATISLNEVDAAKVELGQKATVSFDAIEDLTITGEVAEIDSVGTVSSGVVTYDVKIKFDAQDDRVKPGMTVSATIITDVKQDVLVVSSSALKTKGDTSYVETFANALSESTDGTQGSVSSTEPEQTTVEIGISDDTRTEITSGLKEGDIVVTKTIKGTTSSSSTTSTKSSSSSTKSSTGSMMGGVMGGGPPD